MENHYVSEKQETIERIRTRAQSTRCDYDGQVASNKWETMTDISDQAFLYNICSDLGRDLVGNTKRRRSVRAIF